MVLMRRGYEVLPNIKPIKKGNFKYYMFLEH